MTERTPTALTPSQAADVIRYYDLHENADYHEGRRRNRGTALGLVAIHAAESKHSILPDAAPLLAFDEVKLGLDYINKPPQPQAAVQELGSWPIKPTDDEWEEIDRVSNTRAIPLDEAYASVIGVRPNHWN